MGYCLQICYKGALGKDTTAKSVSNSKSNFFNKYLLFTYTVTYKELFLVRTSCHVMISAHKHTNMYICYRYLNPNTCTKYASHVRILALIAF